jgi:predicted GNAT superfamily acetyltransferase
MSTEIISANTIQDFEAIEWLQAELWGPVGVTPSHLLLTIAKEGGVVLLALVDDRPAGFAFGFIGLTGEGQLKLASHQAGVLPAFQDSGLGYQLKLAQREATLSQGIKLMTWTFDPLQSRNARFNLRKLGVVCRTYLPNLYGEMTDALNQGLPSDRFLADWQLDSTHVVRRLAGQSPEPRPNDYPILNPASQQEGWLVPAGQFNLTNVPAFLVEVPADFSRLKATAPDLALAWRIHTRQIFCSALEAGYAAVDLLRHQGRNYYLLQK